MSSSFPIINNQSNTKKSSCGTNGSNDLDITKKGKNLKIKNFSGRAAVITLGCAKNQVDSEVMLGVLQQNGFEIVTKLEDADVAVVNTCGFLESSVKESIDSIFDAASYKENGRLKRLVVAGCMVERYKDEIVSTLPEVDAFLGVNEILRVAEASQLHSELGELIADAGRPYFLYDDTLPRQLSTLPHTAYIKVSEGCNRPCTFCIIPKIRGTMRSRHIHSIAEEMKGLAQRGVKEINLVAQDLTAFGNDTKEGDLTTLLHALDRESCMPWIRLLYAYPIGVTEELLHAVENLPSICEYFDMPLQHSSESVLKAMKRPLGRFSPRSIVEFIRDTAPTTALRTTFIVGFPGETEKDIDDLEAFIQEGHFENVGIFTYSREAGTPSNDYEEHIPEKEKKARKKRLMLAQQKIMKAKNKAKLGKVFEVLIEGVHEDSEHLLVGRTRFQAPEVDGTVVINDIALPYTAPKDLIGNIYPVKITEIAGYDLIGKVE
jgi:ribosomal protein S12 methylthiotransferase